MQFQGMKQWKIAYLSSSVKFTDFLIQALGVMKLKKSDKIVMKEGSLDNQEEEMIWSEEGKGMNGGKSAEWKTAVEKW